MRISAWVMARKSLDGHRSIADELDEVVGLGVGSHQLKINGGLYRQMGMTHKSSFVLNIHDISAQLASHIYYSLA